ncbi:hypothetical protein [Alkaliphilus oremlandii]|uniref:Uncharacterized protein n=1 Tax=Alkaliphilus oremlandii (strain OhILAs) TaxID=350688 RepID=A8MET6_ALKOO|nr:hypothetical protein [Alkaliphilus oremlandii]ABW18415.1 conserved hypothetical protein [Alkaliphilus oremlandii OhILAs]
MSKLQGEKLGLRENETNRLISIYPYEVKGTDAEIEKKVKDWFYKQGCANEDVLLNAYVDILKDQEID